jgi:hypothetical protein
VIPGIPEIVRGLGASGPWVILDFILTSDSVLDGLSPREALLQGGEMYSRVMSLVRAQ